METIHPSAPATGNPIAALRRFTRPRAIKERCELCAVPLAPDHQHLLQPKDRQLLCACDACAILFSNRENTTYRRVPRRIERWSDFHLTDPQWAGLGVPIALAFFFRSTPLAQVVAMYPSPGGPTEALLPDDAWQGLLDDNPLLATLEPDVEALLVNRVDGARAYFRAPIDECYKLVGVVRTHWRGLSGGKQVWLEIEQFFEHLNLRSVGVKSHA